MNDLLNHIADKDLRLIAEKISGNVRITPEDGLYLYEKTDLSGGPAIGMTGSLFFLCASFWVFQS